MATRSALTKVDVLVAKMVQAIEQGPLTAGSRLRSVRDAADKEGVGINTVVEAYSRLVARGYVESRVGSGYYVRRAPEPSPLKSPSHVAQAIDVVSLLREQLEQQYAVRVGDGRPPASWMTAFDLSKLRQWVQSHDAHIPDHGYGSPWGYGPLRETIARSLNDRAIPAQLNQVLLTQGANHALDLIVRQYIEPGDCVLVDAPGYYPLFGKLTLAKATMLAVPREADGPNLERLRALLAEHRPRAYFTQSLAHNPTGNSISLGKAHKLLQLTLEANCLVVEDDPFADLLPDSMPRLAQLDQLEHVLYVSSFSKTLSAGLRVGFIAGASANIHALCDLKMLTIVSTSDVVERALHQLMSSGQYRRHINRLKTRLQEAYLPAVRALERTGAMVHPGDSGGYYLWVQLPTDKTDIEVASMAAKSGIFIAPGSVFYPDRTSPHTLMRVNIAYANNPIFLKFLRRVISQA